MIPLDWVLDRDLAGLNQTRELSPGAGNAHQFGQVELPTLPTNY